MLLIVGTIPEADFPLIEGEAFGWRGPISGWRGGRFP
jgi:hypothetical protein